MKKEIDNGFYPHHACSICGCHVGYYFDYGRVYFDSSCDCSSYPSEPEPRTMEEFERFLDSKKPNTKEIADDNKP